MTGNIVAYFEGEFQFDSNSYIEGSTVSVKMVPLMKANKEDNRHISLQLTVVYIIEGKVLMKYGGVVSYNVEDWMKVQENADAFALFKKNLWEQTISFFRGIVCEKLRGTAIERMFVPMMPADNIAAIPFEVG